MGWITPFFSLLGLFGGQFGDFFKKQAQVQIEQLELDRIRILEQGKLAEAQAQAQAEVQRTIIDATGRRFKYFTFVMWFGPFILGVYHPAWAATIFNNLKMMPDWYVQSCMTIMFTIWGIQVAAPVISSVFSNLTSYLSDRRQDKLELHRVGLDSYKKAYFDVLRNVKGNVTPQDVAIQDKVLDILARQ